MSILLVYNIMVGVVQVTVSVSAMDTWLFTMKYLRNMYDSFLQSKVTFLISYCTNS